MERCSVAHTFNQDLRLRTPCPKSVARLFRFWCNFVLSRLNIDCNKLPIAARLQDLPQLRPVNLTAEPSNFVSFQCSLHSQIPGL